jgi:hypothetical protein
MSRRRPPIPEVWVDLDFSEIQSGSVVVHDDGSDGNTHHAIVLDVQPDGLAYILMFSSKEVGTKCRPITKDEIALAGFVSSKRTFISLKRRPIWELQHRGVEFPKHRIEDLKREFLGYPSEWDRVLNASDCGV